MSVNARKVSKVYGTTVVSVFQKVTYPGEQSKFLNLPLLYNDNHKIYRKVKGKTVAYWMVPLNMCRKPSCPFGDCFFLTCSYHFML